MILFIFLSVTFPHFRLLNQDIVVLGSYDAIKEAHSNPLLDNRPANPVVDLLYCASLKKRGIIFNNTEEWKTLRRFSLKTLRNCWFAKAKSEDGIIEECQTLIHYFETEGADQTEVQ